MYSNNTICDSDSVTSFSSTSSSSPPIDGVIFSENIQEWFQFDKPYQPEIEPSNTNVIYPTNVVQEDNSWQCGAMQSENSDYTYILDSFTNYSDSSQSEESVEKSGRVKRRRVQTPYQRKAANVRERRRMCTMNKAFEELRERLPAFDYEKKLSRIETLKLAMTYISFMKDLSDGQETNNVNLFQRQRHFKETLLQITSVDGEK